MAVPRLVAYCYETDDQEVAVATRNEVFAAAYRVALKKGVKAVSQRAVLAELGRGSFALGPLIEEWKREQLKAGEVPPHALQMATELVRELWQLAKHAAREEMAVTPHGALSRGSRRALSLQKRRLTLGEHVEQKLRSLNRPLLGAEIYRELPEDVRTTQPDKMNRELMAAKASTHLVQLKDLYDTKDNRWWLSDVALPKEFLAGQKEKPAYTRVDTDLALKRQRLTQLTDKALELLGKSAEPMHIDAICAELKIDQDHRREFRRSLYRRSLYDQRIARTAQKTYAAVSPGVDRNSGPA